MTRTRSRRRAAEHPVDRVVTHRILDVGEVRLHAVEAGPPDGPLVLLLHGFPEFWFAWRHQIGPLAAAGLRVVAPDLRGYGLSDKPHGLDAYSARSLSADVAGLVAALGATRATVVGHDWGGAVAWMTADRRPEVMERLVVVNAPHPARFVAGLSSPEQLLRSSYMAAFQLPWLPEWLLSVGDAVLLRHLLRLAAATPAAFTAADLDRYAEAFCLPGAAAGALAYYRSMGRQLAGRGRPSGAEEGPPLEMAVMTIWGTRDPALPTHLADPGRRRVPNHRLELIESAGHFVQVDAPDRVTGLLLDFIAG